MSGEQLATALFRDSLAPMYRNAEADRHSDGLAFFRLFDALPSVVGNGDPGDAIDVRRLHWSAMHRLKPLGDPDR